MILKECWKTVNFFGVLSWTLEKILKSWIISSCVGIDNSIIERRLPGPLIFVYDLNPIGDETHIAKYAYDTIYVSS